MPFRASVSDLISETPGRCVQVAALADVAGKGRVPYVDDA